MNKLSSLTVSPTSKHTATIIFLHGLGDSGNGWKDVADMLGSQLPHCKWIFPHAPPKPVSLNFGMTMPAWYDIYALDETAKEDEKGMFETITSLSVLIQQEIDSGIPSHRIVLGGFSQGAAISLLYGVTTNVKLGGLIACSGYLPLSIKISTLAKEINKNTLISMHHGTMDEVVLYKWGQHSHEKLKSMGFNAIFHSYKGMGHSACQDEFQDLLSFLTKVL